VDLTDKIRLLKAFSNLRLHTKARRTEKKTQELVQDTHNKEKLNARVEDLLREEVRRALTAEKPEEPNPDFPEDHREARNPEQPAAERNPQLAVRADQAAEEDERSEEQLRPAAVGRREVEAAEQG